MFYVKQGKKNMKISYIVCDKCDASESRNWYHKIVHISIKCPPDGVNDGIYEKDLCFECRTKLNSLLKIFFEKQECST